MAEGSGGEWTVEWYEMRGGRVPLAIFLDSLPEPDAKRAFALLAMLKARGNQVRPPHSKVVEPGLNELRGGGGSQVRMFYIFRPGRRVVMLDGILKKQDAISRDVLERMRAYRRDVEGREQKAQ